jgi:SanA protein
MKTLFLILMLAIASALIRPERYVRLAETAATSSAAWWTQDQIFDHANSAPSADWALVPGTSIWGEKLRQRCETAAALYHTGKVKRLLLSGDGRRTDYDEPATMRRQLLKLGVPSLAMTEDRTGLSTYDSVQKAFIIAGDARWIIVTQATFAPRALLLAQGSGLRAVAVIASSAGVREPAATTRREGRATVRAFLDLMGIRNLTEKWERVGEVRLLGIRVASL